MKALSRMMAALMVLGVFTATPAVADSVCTYYSFFGHGGLAVFGLNKGQSLVTFRECRPKRVRTVGRIVGLQVPDTALVGIDFRIQDGQLYGVGDGGGVYTIHHETAVATLVSRLTAALEGTSFGVDFNPAADRLRIISDTGQNLRHNVNAGGVTVVDGALNYTAGTAAAGVAGAAYTNNDLDATTGTTLFDIDSSLNQVAIQSPPNAGSLVATGQLTVDPDMPIGFDIYTERQKGIAVDNSGYASLSVGGVTGFYRVNIITGKASLIDPLGEPLIDIALPVY